TVAAFDHGLTPIVCVGETLEQREANETLTHIKEQVKAALESLKAEQIKETIIAYEPIWAIGTGKTATSTQDNEVCKHIRNVVRDLTNEDVAQQFVINYGGLVKPDKIDMMIDSSEIAVA